MKVETIQPMATIHPRSVKGRFRSFKTAVMLIAYLTYFVLPWIPWDRAIGFSQAVMFDLNARKFYIFDLVIHAQDIFWLAALLFLAAVLLFFATALAGRLFCGYFCFQTLWTDAFRMIEKHIQGEKVARIRLDKQAWNQEKIIKKGLTHILWLILALWTGLSFILYWGYAPDLVVRFFSGDAHSAAYTTVLILTVTTYFAAGFMREKICMHVCPYARFQSVMIDRDSMVIAYDFNRGEGANGRVKPIRDLKQQAIRQERGYGDCVDCGFCVQVCPTGIDIRDGLQYSCIQCGLCIDACDNIMDKQGWSRGLVRYASDNELGGGKTQFLKLRTYGYGLATVFSILFLIWSISGKTLVDTTVLQERSPLYVTLSDGRIQNRYTIKLDNKSLHPVRFTLSVEGLSPDVVVDMGKIKDFYLKPDTSRRVMVKVKQQPDKHMEKSTEFRFILNPVEGEIKDPIVAKSHFFIP